VRLTSVRIRDVRSVWGPPLDVPVGEAATVLVGPNRAGTSNVAWAVIASLDPTARWRPGRDLPRDGTHEGAQPRVDLRWDGGHVTTVTWDRDHGTRQVTGAPIPPGPVVFSLVHETPRDVLRRATAAVPDLDLGRLTEVVRATCRHVLPEVAEVTVTDRGAVQVRDDLGAWLAVPETRALVTVGVAAALAEQGTPPVATVVEAPEAFLHPAAQETFAAALVAHADRTAAPVVVTTSSPFAIPRVPSAHVVAVARDANGRTTLVGDARGDETQARLLGGLLRDAGLAAVLDRVGQLPSGTRGVLIVEGGTDQAYLDLAARRLDRTADLDRIVVRPAGGAMAAAMAAVVLRAEVDVPVVVLLDHDDPGRRARDTLVSRFGFARSVEVLTYAEVFDGGPPGVEAETLFDVGLVRRFVRERGPAASRGERRVHGLEHVELTSSGKAAFVRWLEEHADPEHLVRWGTLLDLLADRFVAPGRPSPR
jgi:5S rRNA maturation endonuclease (ribonuclease M5)